MEDTRKRPGYGDTATEDTSEAKRTRHEEEVEVEVEGDILAWLSEDEDTVSQLMELLDNAEKKSDNNTMAKVRFIDDMYSAPFSYVTINGNEESCGSSFSDLDSSVMASVDTRGLVGIGSNAFGFGFKAEEHDGACGSSDVVAREGSVASGEEVVRAMDGCDDFGWDDQVLARFLGEDF